MSVRSIASFIICGFLSTCLLANEASEAEAKAEELFEDAYLAVADKHNQAGKLDEYIEYLSLAVQQSPQTSSLHMKLASAMEEARRYDQAIEQWRMVLDLEPDHPQRTELLNLIKKRRGT